MVRRNVRAATLFPSFSRPFLKIHFWMHFDRPFIALWLTFGSLWAPFGSLWLPFAPLWLPFGSLWHSLGDLLAPIGSPLAPVGSLLLPLEVDFVTFAASSPHFGSSLYKFARNPNKGVLSVSFCIEFSFFNNPFAKNRRNSKANRSKINFTLQLAFQGPGAEPCLWQLRSAPCRRHSSACLRRKPPTLSSRNLSCTSPFLHFILLALHLSCTSPFSHFTFSCTSPFCIFLFLSFTFSLLRFNRSCTSSFCTSPFLSFTAYFLHLTVLVHDSPARRLLFCNIYQNCSNLSCFFDGIYSASTLWDHFSAENPS